MTRIDWGEAGSAIYEHGIDRGVLYPRAGDGVPWVGLVGIDENVAGGAHTPYYYDGIKYYDFVSSEDFQAQVEAYSSPPEFAACDGVHQLSPGLYATQQRRERFDLSYRTLIANEFDDRLAYKLHLVYNCTAAPSPRSYATIGPTPSAPTRTWIFHTVPPLSSTFKPTAHFVIDSREIHPGRLAAIEDILYGDESVDSSMISLEDLLEIMNDPGPIQRTNFIIDPRVANTTDWRASAGYTLTDLSGTDGIQVDRAASGSGLLLAIYNFTQPAVADNQKWAGHMQIEVPVGFPTLSYTARVVAVGSSNTTLSSKSGTISAGQTVNISTEFLSLPTEGIAATARLGLNIQDPPAGMRVILKRALLERGTELAGTYFHGNTTDTEDIQYSWDGDVDASYSRARSWTVL